MQFFHVLKRVFEVNVEIIILFDVWSVEKNILLVCCASKCAR